MRAFIASLFVGLFFVVAAGAQEPQHVRGLFCDQPEQVETFIRELQKGASAQDAVRTVNEAAGGESPACSPLDGVALVGEPIGTPQLVEQGTVSIVPVLLLGVMTPQGVARIEPPAPQYVPRLEASERS